LKVKKMARRELAGIAVVASNPFSDGATGIFGTRDAQSNREQTRSFPEQKIAE
jgi:hypothetical protein